MSDTYAVPAPGTDPDSQQRLAKTMVAAGVDPDDLPDDLSVDPVTDEDREAHQERYDKAIAAAEKRQQAADKGTAKPTQTTPPAGRSSRPTTTT